MPHWEFRGEMGARPHPCLPGQLLFKAWRRQGRQEGLWREHRAGVIRFSPPAGNRRTTSPDRTLAAHQYMMTLKRWKACCRTQDRWARVSSILIQQDTPRQVTAAAYLQSYHHLWSERSCPWSQVAFVKCKKKKKKKIFFTKRLPYSLLGGFLPLQKHSDY